MSSTDTFSLSSGTTMCPHCGAVYAGMPAICSRCGTKLNDSVGEYPPGAVIDGKYEVITLLGVGGMGEVYKAHHLHLNAFRCIKVMRKNLLTDETFRMRFIREARLATQIQHPNLAVLHDFSTLPDGSYYMVWEFIDGTSVRQWAAGYGRFPLDVAVEIALQVLAGLEHCHRRGLLHRDISPDNIMVASDPEDLRVKIIDLGIAKMIDAPRTESTQATQVGLYVGNPKYSSPEQLGGLEDGEAIDGRTDLYSLGVVLYEMLLGVPPFTSKTPHGYIIKHLTQPPAHFADIDADFVGHEALEQIVFKALEKDRVRRYSSARDFAAALRSFQIDRAQATGLDSGTNASQRSRKLMLEALPMVGVTIEQMSPDASQTVVKPVTPRAGEDQQAWERASRLDTFDSYEEFLRQYPSSERSAQARARIERLLLDRIDQLESQRGTAALWAVSEGYPERTRVGDAARRALARLTPVVAGDDESAWNVAVAAGTTDAMRTFAQQHPRSRRATSARVFIEEDTLFEAASTDDSIDAWDQFLSMHPSGPHAAEARHRRDAAVGAVEEQEAFASAREAGEPEKWRRFLEQYPGSSLAPEAQRAVDELTDLAVARSANDESIWSSFAERWTDSAHRPEAIGRREELRAARAAFEAAAGIGSAAALKSFVEAHPAAKNAGAARELLAEAAAFEQIASGDIAAAERFLVSFPEGKHAEQVHALRSHWTAGEAFERARTFDNAEGWRQFLEQHGQVDRELASRARKRLDEIADQAFQVAQASRSIDALQLFVDRFPESSRGESAKQLLRLLETERDVDVFLAATDPAACVAPIVKLDTDAANAIISKAESEEKIGHLAALAKQLDSRQLRRAADEARARVVQVRQKREAEAADWNTAEGEGSAQRWRAFLKKHPDSPRILLARQSEERALDFEAAVSSGSIALLKAYIDSVPEQRYRELAEKRLGELKRGAGAAATAHPIQKPKRQTLTGPWREISQVAEPAPESGDGPIASVVKAADAASQLVSMAAAPHADLSLNVDDIPTVILKKSPVIPESPREPAGEPAAPEAFGGGATRPVPALDLAERSRHGAGVSSQSPAVRSMPRELPPPPVSRRPRRPGVAAIYYMLPVVAFVALALIIGGGVVLYLRYQSVKVEREKVEARLIAERSRAILVLDARPWGEVTAVTTPDGRELMEKGKPLATPAAIAVDAGEYSVTFSGPDGKTVTEKVEVAAASAVMKTVNFRDVDVGQYFAKAGWR